MKALIGFLRSVLGVTALVVGLFMLAGLIYRLCTDIPFLAQVGDSFGTCFAVYLPKLLISFGWRSVQRP